MWWNCLSLALDDSVGGCVGGGEQIKATGPVILFASDASAISDDCAIRAPHPVNLTVSMSLVWAVEVDSPWWTHDRMNNKTI